MAFVRSLRLLCKDKNIEKRIVPIIPDEARTFAHPLFREIGIYSSKGQKYDPVDSEQFLYYKEAKDGQILEEGSITEAGSISSFCGCWDITYHERDKNDSFFHILFDVWLSANW